MAYHNIEPDWFGSLFYGIVQLECIASSTPVKKCDYLALSISVQILDYRVSSIPVPGVKCRDLSTSVQKLDYRASSIPVQKLKIELCWYLCKSIGYIFVDICAKAWSNYFGDTCAKACLICSGDTCPKVCWCSIADSCATTWLYSFVDTRARVRNNLYMKVSCALCLCSEIWTLNSALKKQIVLSVIRLSP